MNYPIHRSLFNNYNNIPDKFAVIDARGKHTYNKLWLDCIVVAEWLDSNFKDNSTVGVLLDNSYEAVVAMYSVFRSTAICVPIDTDLHKNNIKYIINDVSMSLLITSTKYSNTIQDLTKEFDLKILIIENYISAIKKDRNITDLKRSANTIYNTGNDICEADTAIILYTTGTTGPKKGVALSHLNLMAATKNINDFMGIGKWALESVPMRLSHSFGFARLRCIIEVGGTVLLENGFLRPERLLNNMKYYQANAISSVPAGFSILLEYYKNQFEKIGSSIRYIEIGSSFMSNGHKNLLMEICPNARICMHYGLTESSRTTFIEFHSEEDHLDTVGRPLPLVELKIVSENGRKLGPNNIGEIYVKGKIIMKEYWRKKGLTNQVLKDGWLHTGDLGSLDDLGYLHLLGRKSELINIGGLKVAPGEVEEVLLKYDSIVEACVLGAKSSSKFLDVNIIAFIVTEGYISIESLNKFCMDNIESYKIPTEFKIVDKLPRTNSGKIKRNILKDILNNNEHSDGRYKEKGL